MRLIRCHTLQLQEFFGPQRPPYAILSHTWQDEEVTFAEFSHGAPVEKDAVTKGWKKIMQTCKLSIEQGYNYVWIDTCCIDKSSSAELTEAINSMYAWYAGSGKCFVYLSDFDSSAPGLTKFSSSRWFSRGWTLQELIAPKDLQFYDSSWTLYGSKASLSANIAHATGIDQEVLCTAGSPLQWLLASIPVCQKMAWAAGRKTRRPEDVAYSLLGIFGIHLPLVYGEGANAFTRLQRKIIKSTNDLTILAWKTPELVVRDKYYNVLAPSPECFAESKDIVLSQDLRYNPDFSITNKGLQITVALPAVYSSDKTIMSLHCHYRDAPLKPLGIYLCVIGDNVYSRILANVIPVEVTGRRLAETSIFLSIKPYQGTLRNLALARGYDFAIDIYHGPTITKEIQLLSAFPENRWAEEFGFSARDKISFVGFGTYRTFWENKTSDFVIVYAFNPDQEPWICVNCEGSYLWFLATRCDYMSVVEHAQKIRRNQVTLENNIFLSVQLKIPNLNYVQVIIHVEPKSAYVLKEVETHTIKESSSAYIARGFLSTK